MALFRKKQKEDVPAELEAFYEQEPAWKRWLRRLLAVLIIIALVAAIVWAAMRVYEQVTNRDVDLPGPESSEIAQNPSDDTSTTEESDTTAETPAPNNEDQAATGNDTESAQQGSDSSESESEGTVDSGAVSTTTDGQTMPSTGPADALWIVLGVVITSIIAYQLKLRKQ